MEALSGLRPFSFRVARETTMTTPMPAADVLDREFLQIRAKLLELAASFDRFDRGNGSVGNDPRIKLIHQALDVLAGPSEDRTEQIQLLFSREYEPAWREQLGVDASR